MIFKNIYFLFVILLMLNGCVAYAAITKVGSPFTKSLMHSDTQEMPISGVQTKGAKNSTQKDKSARFVKQKRTKRKADQLMMLKKKIGQVGGMLSCIVAECGGKRVWKRLLPTSCNKKKIARVVSVVDLFSFVTATCLAAAAYRYSTNGDMFRVTELAAAVQAGTHGELRVVDGSGIIEQVVQESNWKDW
jgi:hypothetical protein